MAKKSKAYWEKRFELLEDAQSKKGAEYFAELEKQYNKAALSVQADISKWYVRFADNNGITLQEARKMLNAKELKEFKWTVMDYIEKGKTLNISDQWAKQLENASARFHISRLEALKIQMQNHVEALYGNEMDDVSSLMEGIYTEGYYHTAYEIQKGFNIGYDLMKLDADKVQMVLSKPWAADGSNFSDRIWKQKAKLVTELHTGLTQAIIRGQNPNTLIDDIAKKFNVSKGRAGALVMTEAAFFNSASNRDCYNDLDVEQYEILATLDRRTSDICQDLDGKVFKMSEYMVGATAPPFHVRCRTTTVPYFDDEFELGSERVARGDDGETYYVPANTTYKEWKKAFVDGGSKKDLTPIEKMLEEVDETSDRVRLDARKNDEGTSQEKALDKTPLSSHETAEIDYRAEKVTFKDLQEWKKSIGNVTDEEYSIIDGMSDTGYIKSSNSYKINKAMREGTVHELSEGNQKTIETLKEVISKNVSDMDAVLIRKVDRAYLESVYNIESTDLVDIVDELNTKKLGETYIEKGFVSTSYKADKNINMNDEIELDIYAPKGTNMFLTKNRTESEIILQAGTQFELEGAVLTDNGKVRLLMKVVDQPLENIGKSGRIKLGVGSSSGSKNGTSKRYELGQIDAKYTEDAISELSEEIRHSEVENAIVIDKNGNVVHFKGNEQDAVEMYDVDFDGATVLHNHPEANGITSFGEDDFVFLREYQKLKSFRCCNPMYDYSVVVTKDISNMTYNSLWREAMETFFDYEDDDMQHIVFEILQKKGYVKYERRKR